jgi:hypothetical protein
MAMLNWTCVALLFVALGQFEEEPAKTPKKTPRSAKKTVPKSNAKAPPRPTPSTFPEHVAEMFHEGYGHGTTAMRSAQKEYTTARKMGPDDARVEYAFGLVQARQLHHQAATKQFKLATETGTKPFWPAWQALVWSECSAKHTADGLAHLISFAELVQKNDGDGTVQQADAANWIGQSLEALDRTLTSERDREELQKAAKSIGETLDDELRDSLKQGRALIEQKWKLLTEQAHAAVEDRTKKKTVENKAKEGEIDSLVTEIDKEKVAAARSREQWDAWIQEQLPKFDKQLESLEKDYLFLDQRASSLSLSIQLLNDELAQLQASAARQIGQAGALQVSIQNRQNTLAGYQLDYNSTVERLNAVAVQANGVVEARNSAVDQYQDATGQLVKKDKKLTRWGSRLGEKKRKLQTQPPAKDLKDSLDRKLDAFRTYVELDLDAERNRVLKLVGAPVPAPPVPPALNAPPAVPGADPMAVPGVGPVAPRGTQPVKPAK